MKDFLVQCHRIARAPLQLRFCKAAGDGGINFICELDGLEFIIETTNTV